MDPSKDITPAVLLAHIQAVGNDVRTLDTRLGTVERSLGSRIDRLQSNLTAQINAIDKRLDAVEIEFLPKRVRSLEQAVFGA